MDGMQVCYSLFFFGRHYSSTLLVLMSVENCFAVYFPLKSKTVCTVKTAKWATGIVGVILAGYDSVYIFVTEVWELSGRQLCGIRAIRGKDWETLNFVDSVQYSFGPFVLMFIINFALVFMFMRAKCKSTNSTESTNQAVAKVATRGTVMVVTVSVTFLILTTPTAVNNDVSGTYSLGQTYALYWAFMNLTQYLNHSINGILYCTVGSEFRQEFFKIICRKEKTMHSINICNRWQVTGQFSFKTSNNEHTCDKIMI